MAAAIGTAGLPAHRACSMRSRNSASVARHNVNLECTCAISASLAAPHRCWRRMHVSFGAKPQRNSSNASPGECSLVCGMRAPAAQRAGTCLRIGSRAVPMAEPAAAQAMLPVPQTTDEAIILLERLQRATLEAGSEDGMNLVALGGGMAATLAAFLVHSVFEERCAAVFVWLPGTTSADFDRAQYLASFLGMELWQLQPPQSTPNSDSAELDSSRLTSSAELASGVELGALNGELDAGAGSPDDEDAAGSPALQGALEALRAAFWDREGPPVVVFDGLHAEDLPQPDEVSTWDGSEDFGEQLGAYHTSATEFVDRDVAWLSLDDGDGGGVSSSRPKSDAAVALGARLTGFAGLPLGRRVSLLAGLPEIGVRAVADLAGMPNWDWLPDTEASHAGDRPPGSKVSATLAGTDPVQENTSAAVGHQHHHATSKAQPAAESSRERHLQTAR